MLRPAVAQDSDSGLTKIVVPVLWGLTMLGKATIRYAPQRLQAPTSAWMLLPRTLAVTLEHITLGLEPLVVPAASTALRGLMAQSQVPLV